MVKKKPRQRYSREEVNTLRAMRLAGKGYAEIGAALGRSRNSISGAVALNGLALITKDSSDIQAALRANARRRNPANDRVIARQFGCHFATVGRIRRRLGIPAVQRTYESYSAVRRRTSERAAAESVRSGWPAVGVGARLVLADMESIGRPATSAEIGARRGLYFRYVQERLYALKAAGYVDRGTKRVGSKLWATWSIAPAVAARRAAVKRYQSQGD